MIGAWRAGAVWDIQFLDGEDGLQDVFDDAAGTSRKHLCQRIPSIFAKEL
jgi:hypothetical protein